MYPVITRSPHTDITQWKHSVHLSVNHHLATKTAPSELLHFKNAQHNLLVETKDGTSCELKNGNIQHIY